MTYGEIRAKLEEKFPSLKMFKIGNKVIAYVKDNNKISCYEKQIEKKSDLDDLEKSKKFEFRFLTQEFSDFIFDSLSHFLSYQFGYKRIFHPNDLTKKAENFLEFSKTTEAEVLSKLENGKEKLRQLIEKAKEKRDRRYLSLLYEKPEEALCKIFKVSPKRLSNLYVVYDRDYDFKLVSESEAEFFKNRKNLKLLVFEPSRIRKVDFRRKKISESIELDLGFYQIKKGPLESSKAVSKKKKEPIIFLDALRVENNDVKDETVLFSLKRKKPLLKAREIDVFYRDFEKAEVYDFLIVYGPREGLKGADSNKNYFVNLKNFEIICEQPAENWSNLCFVRSERVSELAKDSAFDYAIIVGPDIERADTRKILSVIVKTKDKGFFVYEFKEPDLTSTAAREIDEKEKTLKIYDYLTKSEIFDIDFKKDSIVFYDGNKKVEIDLKTLKRSESEYSRKKETEPETSEREEKEIADFKGRFCPLREFFEESFLKKGFNNDEMIEKEIQLLKKKIKFLEIQLKKKKENSKKKNKSL